MSRLLWISLLLGAFGCASSTPQPTYVPPEPDEDSAYSQRSAYTEDQMTEAQEMAKRRLPSLRNCYDQELQSVGKKFEVTLLLKVHISVSGKPGRIDFGKGTKISPKFAGCLKAAIHTWDFPKPRTATQFHYPVAFSPAY